MPGTESIVKNEKFNAPYQGLIPDNVFDAFNREAVSSQVKEFANARIGNLVRTLDDAGYRPEEVASMLQSVIEELRSQEVKKG